jgi:transposase
VSYNFRSYGQDQLFLMPPSVQEWVPEDSLVRFVSEVVDELERRGRLGEFFAQYRSDGWGAAAYHPVMMVKVMLYGYSVGLTSSRKLAEALRMDVGFRYLAANQQPDHRTIAVFRTAHREGLEGLFTEILLLCKEAGLVKMGRVALDGRRVAGSAAQEANRTRAQLQEEVTQLLNEAAQVDAEEDAQHGLGLGGNELPAGLKKAGDRLQRLNEAIQALEEKQKALQEEQREKIEARHEKAKQSGRTPRGPEPKAPEEVELPPKARANATDPESRLTKNRRGYVQGYNGQAMADCESQVIVAQELTNAENDLEQFLPMLERCRQQAGRAPGQVLADAGYWDEAVGARDGEGGTEFLIAPMHWKNEKTPRPHRDRMAEKLATEAGRAAYAQRCSTIEPVFGQMEMRGLRRFLLRGLKKVGLEWSLWCTTHNLLKLWRAKLRPRMPRRPVPCSA